MVGRASKDIVFVVRKTNKYSTGIVGIADNLAVAYGFARKYMDQEQLYYDNYEWLHVVPIFKDEKVSARFSWTLGTMGYFGECWIEVWYLNEWEAEGASRNL